MTAKIKASSKVACDVPLLYTREKAACMLSISVRSLDHLIRQKSFKVQKIGKKILIHQKELQRFAGANHYGSVKGEPTATSSATSQNA